MTVTSSRSRLRAAALSAALLLLSSACSAPQGAESDATPSETPGPTAAWGEWKEVDELVSPVGSTDDRIILSGIDAPTVVALDRTTGEEAWRIGETPANTAADPDSSSMDEGDWDDSWDSPGWDNGLVLHDDHHVYTQRGSGDGSVVAYNADDGSEVWRVSPGTLDPCAPADGWWLSPSRTHSYEVGEQNRLIVSHSDIAEPSCHDGPNATHPGKAAMVVIDTGSGEIDGEPLKVAGTAIPGMSMPDLTGRSIDTPYELQGSVNVIRQDPVSRESSWAMLDYPQDFSVLESSPVVSDMGGDRFLITYMGGEFVEATVKDWSPDHMEMGDVSLDQLGHDVPCEYRTLRSSTGAPYCLTLTSSPDPAHTPMFLADELDPSTGESTGGVLELPAPTSLDEHYGFVDDRETVENDAYIPPSLLGTAHGVLVLPSDEGLSAVGLGTEDTQWTWSSGEGVASAPHVVPGVDEVVVGLDHRAVGLDVRTGEQLWEVPSEGPVFGIGDAIVIVDFMSSTTQVRAALPLG